MRCKLQVAEAAATLEGPAAGALGLPAVLMRAQLALAGGDRGAALRLLSGLQDEATRHQPAVVATVASLQVCTHRALHVTLILWADTGCAARPHRRRGSCICKHACSSAASLACPVIAVVLARMLPVTVRGCHRAGHQLVCARRHTFRRRPW